MQAYMLAAASLTEYIHAQRPTHLQTLQGKDFKIVQAEFEMGRRAVKVDGRLGVVRLLIAPQPFFLEGGRRVNDVHLAAAAVVVVELSE